MLQLLVTLQALVSDRFDRKDDEGATMIEYGLMVVGIAVIVGVAAALLGGRIAALFGTIIP